jgi:hypothetical protein
MRGVRRLLVGICESREGRMGLLGTKEDVGNIWLFGGAEGGRCLGGKGSAL